MSLSREQILVRVHQATDEIGKFRKRYDQEMAEISDQERISVLPRFGDNTPEGQSAHWREIGDIQQIKHEREENLQIEWQLKYLPNLRELRGELIRRGSSLPNTEETTTGNRTADALIGSGALSNPPDQALEAVVKYLEQLAQYLPA